MLAIKNQYYKKNHWREFIKPFAEKDANYHGTFALELGNFAKVAKKGVGQQSELKGKCKKSAQVIAGVDLIFWPKRHQI